MNIEKKENYTLLKFLDSNLDVVEKEIEELKENHFILQVSENLNIDEAKISLLLNLASGFKSNGMSFVVIKSGIDIDVFPETLNIVPTLQEAEDILEMEAIERDLGF